VVVVKSTVCSEEIEVEKEEKKERENVF